MLIFRYPDFTAVELAPGKTRALTVIFPGDRADRASLPIGGTLA